MTTPSTERVLVFGGKTGWIGQMVVAECKKRGLECLAASSRLEDRHLVEKEIDEYKPTVVMNAAGLTGRPNVDWCEDNKQAVIRVNLIGTLSLIDLCAQRKIHVTNFATGCIFEYDEEHKMGGKTFTEADQPNFAASFYSETKGMVDVLARCYPDLLTLRVRMPISPDLNGRNFVTKIAHYAKIVDVPNSMTVLTGLVPISVDAALRRVKGILNFCNPGVISHNEVMTLFRDTVDPGASWTNFTVDECNAILKAGRSNNGLDCSRLKELFPEVLDIHAAVKQAFVSMKADIDREGVEALQAKGWKFPPAVLERLKKAAAEAKTSA